MKMDKKKIGILVGAGISIAIFGACFVGHGKINDTQNEYVSVQSQINHMQGLTEERLNILNDLKNNMKDYKDEKVLLDQAINESYKAMKIEPYEESTEKMNKNIDILEKVNVSIDALVEKYEQNESLKKDEKLVAKMDKLIEIDYIVDDEVKIFNNKYRKVYNEKIRQFPSNVFLKIQGYGPVKSFKN